MRILIAPDSFKDALPAVEVCRAIEKGILKADETSTIIQFPLADGGEGTAGILAWHNEGEMVKASFSDPLMRKIEAQYGISADGKTAFIESAETAGLQLLKSTERNCMNTTTFGTGEMIRHAIKSGARKIILGLGGSATNDAGMGMATALGYRFFDENEVELEPVGKNLSKVVRIDETELMPDLKNVEFVTLYDVHNPLYGEKGAAFVFAPQKGANAEEVELLDEGLQHFALKLKTSFLVETETIKGAGAAGGMGAGVVAFLNARLVPGIEYVLEATGFEKQLEDAGLVITGEGTIDEQSLDGKVIRGVAALAAKHGVPVIAFCGKLEIENEQIEKLGLLAAFSIIQKPVSLEVAIENVAADLESLAYNVARTVFMFDRK